MKHRRAENLEAVIVAVALALIIRQFALELFVIPTGSMAPTFYGAHVELQCPNCAYPFSASSPGGTDDDYGNGQETPFQYREVTVTCGSCRTEQKVLVRPNDFSSRRGGVAVQPCENKDCRADIQIPSELAARAEPVHPFHVTCPNCGHEFDRAMPASQVQGGHKVMVNKFIYHFRRPRRWEVAVFKPPHDLDKNYIKRVVGLPGESLDLDNGNLLINGKIARKPKSVQDVLWQPVYDLDFPETAPPRVPAWEERGGQWDLRLADREIHVDATGSGSAGGLATLAYNRDVRDWYAYNVQPGYGGSNKVGDVRLSFEVEVVEGQGWVGGYIEDNLRRYAFRVPVGGEEPARIEVMGRTETQTGDLRLAPGSVTRLSLSHVDRAAYLDAGDDRVLSYLEGGDTGLTESVKVTVQAQGVKVHLRHLKVQRDIYYIRRGIREAVPLGDDEYFVLGDNSPNSRDSRVWSIPAFPEQNLVGRAFVQARVGLPWKMAPWNWDWRIVR